MPDPNPNPDPDPNLDPDPNQPTDTEHETEETEQQQQCVGLRQLGWSALLLLALLAVGIWYAHHRISRRTAVAREEKLYRVQNQAQIVDLQGRTTELEQAITKKGTGILAQVDALAAKNREQDSRLDKVEADQSATATAISGLQQFLERKFGDEALTVEEPVAEDAEAEAETLSEPRAEARPVERPAVVTKPVRKTARAEPEESVARAATPKAVAKPAGGHSTPSAAKSGRKAGKSPAARSGPENPDAFLNAAERIHADAETLLEGALEGRKTTPVQDARIAEHKRRYQPVAIRPTAWRDVRTDETRVVYVGKR